MDAPALFGPFFRDGDWRAWKAFLGALYGLELGPNLTRVYREHTERQHVPTQPVKEAAMVVGRRGGKSRIAALLAVYTACTRDFRPYLAPGERALIPVLAKDKEQAGIIFGYVRAFLEETRALRPLMEGKPTTERVRLRTGVDIRVRAASFRGIRGPTIPLALCDEIAYWQTEDSLNPDHEILRALRPGLLTIPGSMLICLSSPYARRGELWESYREFYGKDDPRHLIWQAPTLAMNPSADQAEIAAAYEKDPTAAAAEYGAEFRSDMGAYVPSELVDAAMEGAPEERPPVTGCHYEAFCDPSGGSRDSMTLAVAHTDGDRLVLDCVRERRPPFSPDAVTAEFATVCKSYGVSSVRGDRYAGEWPRERFATKGITYRPADATKSELYLAFLPALSSGRALLLDHAVLRRQLVALDRRTSRGGRDSVDHPPGAHDDVVNAAVGALVMADGGIGVKAGAGMLRFAREEGARLAAEQERRAAAG